MALGTNQSIKQLVLSNCIIPDVGYAALATVLAWKSDIQVTGFGARSHPALIQPGLDAANDNVKQGTSTAAVISNTASPFTANSTATPSADFQIAHSNAVHERGMADSAIEVQAAFASDKPVLALQRLFSERADVRIEVPANIVWSSSFDNATGNGHEDFSRIKCLSKIRLRNIEFIPQPCMTGQHQISQFDFIAHTLDSLSQLPEKSRADISLAIMFPDTRFSGQPGAGISSAQDGLLKSLVHDRLVARLDLGSLAPRSAGSLQLVRFFDSLPYKEKLVELRLCGALLSYAETVALAEGLVNNTSIQQVDLRGCTLHPGAKAFFGQVVGPRVDLKLVR